MSGWSRDWVGGLALTALLTACQSASSEPGTPWEATAADASVLPDASDTAFAEGDAATRALSGRVTYEARLPTEAQNAWAQEPVVLGAAGLTISAMRGDMVVAETITSEQPQDAGAFTLRLGAAADVDRLLVRAHARRGAALDFLVADPSLPASAAAWDMFAPKPLARAWSWEFAVSELEEDGTLQISLARGSAAAHVFALLSRTRRFAHTMIGPDALASTIVWLGLGTRFACGTCATSEPVELLGASFSHQVWLDGSRAERYWADSVTYHEIGHALMGSLSAPQREGGPHLLGQPTHPGQAFGEGWATFFSSLMRQDPSYLDLQSDGFVRFDLSTRTYEVPARTWLRPQAGLGLEQLLDENEVAALLWGLHQTLEKPALMLAALSAPAMQGPSFARGYTRRRWADPNAIQNYQDTGEAHPYLADFLDALRCAGAPAAAFDAVLEPSAFYPYPSAEPVCAGP